MRLRARLIVLLAAMLLLALPAAATAEIKPIPKPDTPVVPATPPAPPATPPAPPPAAPVSKPVNTPVAPSPPATPPAPPPVVAATTPPAPPLETIVVAGVEGGRDQSGVVVPAAPPPDPTPLALVAATETVPSRESTTPIWKIALLALLAAGEAFLIVSLVRRRPGALFPAQS